MTAGNTPEQRDMGYVEFVVLMALVTSTVALSTDAIMPAMPLIGSELGARDDNHRQLVIGILFLGLASSQILFGPLSDSLGRKPVMYVGVALLSIGCLIAIWAPTFEIMLIGRFIQGVGAGGPRVVSVAVIRDRFEGRLMARTMSLIMTIFILVPVFAPTIGQGLMMAAGWRAIFWFFLTMGVSTAAWIYLRMPETLAAAHRHPLSFTRTARAFKEIITTRSTMGYLFSIAFIFAAFVGYLTSAQQILQELYGLGDAFPIAFGLLACSLGISSLLNAKLVMRLGMRKLAYASLSTQVALGTALSITAWAYGGVPPFWLMCALMGPLFFCVGTLFGNLNALAMQPMGHIAGSAAAVIGASTTTISSILGSFIGQAYNETILPLSLGFAVFGSLSLCFFMWAGKGKI